jgi:hypothetical protein
VGRCRRNIEVWRRDLRAVTDEKPKKAIVCSHTGSYTRRSHHQRQRSSSGPQLRKVSSCTCITSQILTLRVDASHRAHQPHALARGSSPPVCAPLPGCWPAVLSPSTPQVWPRRAGQPPHRVGQPQGACGPIQAPLRKALALLAAHEMGSRPPHEMGSRPPHEMGSRPPHEMGSASSRPLRLRISRTTAAPPPAGGPRSPPPPTLPPPAPPKGT